MNLGSRRSRSPVPGILSFCVLAAGAAPPVPGQVSDSQWVGQQLRSWYPAAARAAPGRWGIAVADQSGRILWGLNPYEPMIPASTVKVFTTGFARAVLGGGARRPTRVVGAGEVDSATGEWRGTWGLELNGDPSLERGPDAGPTLYDLAEQLAAAGIRKLAGPLNVQSLDGPATATYPAVWSRHHMGRLFAPPVGPVTLNENVVSVVVQPAARSGVRPRIVGEMPAGVAALVVNRATTRGGRRARLWLEPRPGGWALTGWIGIRGRPRRVSAVANNPTLVLNAAWAQALRRAGISWDPAAFVAPPTTAAPRVLAEVSSPPLDSLASEINRRSLNYAAELLLEWAGGRAAAPARLTDHVREVTGDTGTIHLVDGSGLSGEDRVAPATFIEYLAKFPATAAGRNFPQLLPANGTGTLRRLHSGFPGEGVVRAKTGTLAQVANIVGYLGRPDGVLIVALMYNGPRPWAARKAEGRLLRLLGANGVVIPSDGIPESLEPQFGGEETEPPIDTIGPARTAPSGTDSPAQRSPPEQPDTSALD